MPFDNESNRGRVARMVEALGHIETSAKSNRASPAEIAGLLAPAVARIRELGALEDMPAEPYQAQPDPAPAGHDPGLLAALRAALEAMPESPARDRAGHIAAMLQANQDAR